MNSIGLSSVADVESKYLVQLLHAAEIVTTIRLFFVPERTLVRFHDGSGEDACLPEASVYAEAGTMPPHLADEGGRSVAEYQVESANGRPSTQVNVDTEEFIYGQKITPWGADNLTPGNYTFGFFNTSRGFAKEVMSTRIYVNLPTGAELVGEHGPLPLPANSIGHIVVQSPRRDVAMTACIKWKFVGFSEETYQQRVEYAADQMLVSNEYVDGDCRP